MKSMEDYVSFETAKLLKEKGFKQDCDYATSWYTAEYYKNSVLGEWFEGEHHIIEDTDDRCTISYLSDKGVFIPAPTLQMAMKWLREEHGIGIEISFDVNDNHGIYAGIYRRGDETWEEEIYYSEYYKTYEEAEEATIKYALENLI